MQKHCSPSFSKRLQFCLNYLLDHSDGCSDFQVTSSEVIYQGVGEKKEGGWEEKQLVLKWNGQLEVIESKVRERKSLQKFGITREWSNPLESIEREESVLSKKKKKKEREKGRKKNSMTV